jgi:c-di-GMP-related signal transduction protein
MDIYLVRKPIFDRQQQVIAYEILGRAQLPDSEEISLTSLPTCVAADVVLLIGLHRITRGKKAFIRCDPNAVTEEMKTQLPPSMVIIEVLGQDQPDDLLVAACKRLKDAGYRLALGDHVLGPAGRQQVFDLIDFLRIDFGASHSTVSKTLFDQAAARGIQLLASGVESRADFKLAMDSGYACFQGSFFSRAEIISGRDIPGYKLNHLRMLHELSRDDLDFGALETIIKRDVSLSYTLLNCVNSVFFGVGAAVTSIRHALALLGEREIRKWASMVLLRGLAQDKPAELLVTSLVRANFCGSLAALTGLREKAPELFLMGLFSLLDVMVSRPMDEIMQDMPLAEDIKTALVGGRNQYRGILELVESYEKGDLGNFLVRTLELHLDEGLITDLYLRSIDLAEEAMQLYGARGAVTRQQP